MPQYEYIALNPRGKQIKGSIDSDNVRVARQKLRGQGIFPTEIKESLEAAKTPSRDLKRYFKSDRVSTKDLSIATRQLGTLTRAGLPLVTALHALSDQTDSETLRKIVVDVREKVQEGFSLAKALSNFPKVFPKLYVNMIASGEASGTLDAVLESLSAYLEAQLELRRRVSSALYYPIIMFFFCTLVVSALLMFVVPKVVDMFKSKGSELPLPTKIMIALSNFILNYWWLLAAAIVLTLVLARWYYRQEKGREKIDRLLLNLPLFGSIYTGIFTSRVTSTLGALLKSGVGLLEALEITRGIVNNVHVSRALEEAGVGVREGRSLARELSKSGIFPSMVGHMIAVGEKSGELDSMLVKVGDVFDKDVKATLSGLTSLIEPIMMVVMGAVVFAIVISILLPMVDLIDVVQQ